jgi:cytochrome c551/c552
VHTGYGDIDAGAAKHIDDRDRFNILTAVGNGNQCRGCHDNLLACVGLFVSEIAAKFRLERFQFLL